MQALNQYLQEKLEDIYPKSELDALKKIVLEHVLEWNFTKQHLNQKVILKKNEREKIYAIINQLATGEPIQYILQKTTFFDLPIKVKPGVLIPRQETEELVNLIIRENSMPQPTILDIGTGSGCIAIALKKYIANSNVFAIDKSAKALEIAQKNAQLNKAEIKFNRVDILNWQNYHFQQFDIIVSNPPYVMEQEKVMMQANVLDFEPKEALFVSNKNPLIFYNAIAQMARKHLNKGGKLYFEINENLSQEMYALMQKLQYKNIEIKKDINGKMRMLRCVNQ